MNNINFLPWRQARSKRMGLAALFIMISITLLFLAISLTIMHNQNKKIENFAQNKNLLEKKNLDQLKNKIKSISDQIEWNRNAETSLNNLDRLLDVLSVFPNLETTIEKKQQTISIRGIIDTEQSLGKIETQLKQLPFVKNLETQIESEKTKNKKTVFYFSMILNLAAAHDLLKEKI